MDLRPIIAVRRDRGIHSAEDLTQLAVAAATGSAPDYQLAAWLMAAFLNPLTERETADLTLAMANSGQRLDLAPLPKPWVDKHSTGGVGDKTTLVVLPILAACGLSMVKMSGRGLGKTGGTIDKLHAIPGFRTDLSPTELLSQAQKIGLAIAGQSPDLAPADGTLYALRDVTETTGSLPLIVSSILSKKLAAGAETVVLDVKWGRGAFMATREDARALARSLRDVGQRCGLRVEAILSSMDEPLGAAVGNALEVTEALDVLGGSTDGPRERALALATEVAALALVASGKFGTEPEARDAVAHAITSGQAHDRAMAWFAAQGAELPLLLPIAPTRTTLRADQAGWIRDFDAEIVADALLDLGGGRRTKSDAIDPRVGFVRAVSVGDRVAVGDPLVEIHAATEAQIAPAEASLRRAIKLSPEPVSRPPLWDRSF